MIPDRLPTLADFERFLATATNYEEKMPRPGEGGGVERHFDLARMTALLDALGRPERAAATTVHVTGSKGKGSTCRMVDSILRAARRGPVGLYTSPHLESLTERVVVDGKPVAGVALANAAEALLPHLRATSGTPLYPTFFEILTAAAHVAFREAGVRTAILEVGLGGRLDATNCCRPAVTAITTIELEHTKVLGDTLEKIAFEKAGIVKPGVPCVTAVPAKSPAFAVIERRTTEVGAPLHRVHSDSTPVPGGLYVDPAVTAGPGPRVAVRVRGLDAADATLQVELPVAGAHQAWNAAVAIAIARLLRVEDPAIVSGLASVSLAGRVEKVLARPDVVIDGAHTAASARSTRGAVAACFPHRALHLVVGVLEEKDSRAIVAPLVDGAATVVACAVPSPRGLSPERLADVVRSLTSAPTTTAPDAATGLGMAIGRAAADDLVLVSGSLYLAGAARAAARRRPGFLPKD